VLFGAKYWDEVINFDALVRYGTISAGDLELFHRTDSIDEAFELITHSLITHSLSSPGATL
jgi:predicted Rossmann-fold nucleotide-binding protein